MNIERLKSTLLKHEAEVSHAYEDSEGYLTVGVGRLIDKRKDGGISHTEAMYLLDDLASLLLIEYNEKEWYVSKPCLNLFDGLSNKATITGARSPYSLT